MDTFQNLGTPNRSRFGVFKLSKPKRLKSRHGLPDSVSAGPFVYRALSELDADGAWGTWLGEQRDASGATRPVLLKHTGENNRTRAGADALWLEALLTFKLDGPQVVPLLDYGVLDGRPFAIYGFEEGVFLAQVIEGLRERGRRLPSGVAVGIILQACELVKRLHKLSLEEEEGGAAGFVHGSLCPRNFMLSERGDVKVMGLIGCRPVGRVVGREHVPAAAMAYASPDLLGGAPVTPAVDVHSLGAVLQELLGDESDLPEGERDELGGILRELVRSAPGAGFSTVEAFAAALQDAVRRTGTVVARQSIGAQVRGVCEQYLLERRRQVRNLRDAEWVDQRDAASSRPAVRTPVAGVDGSARSAPSPAEMEDIEAGAEDGVDLNEYEEDAGDDAVTRIYDGEDLEAEGPAQSQAWMHDSKPADAGKSGWSRWAVVALLGVLVAVASGAAVMASRSVARGPQLAGAAEAKLAAAGASQPRPAEATSRAVEPARKPSVEAAAPVAMTKPAASGTLTALRGQGNADEPSELKGVAAGAEAADTSDDSEPRARNAGARERPMLRRTAAVPKRAAAPQAKVVPAAGPAQPEPVTVDVSQLPEAREEPEPVPEAPAPKRPPAKADGDLVIEEGAPKVAFLSVDAAPYATVFIDGTKKGVTPLVAMELSPGLHRMIARTEDGRTKRYTLQLEAGKTEAVKVSWE
jgi:eukaryotic-like serine/threonine-protein kinase